MYTESDLIAVAKRENNKKRTYLIVNKLQGKHIPVSPKDSFFMFHNLAQIVKEEYLKERLLLIGFAETATAIGAELAIELDSYYIQTTRENIRDVDYLFFTEDHSHAMEQKLVRNDIEHVLDLVDRVIFVEDEVTTGNTILNIINIIEKKYPKKVAFSVASLLNGMDQQALSQYQQRNIKVHYLLACHMDYTRLVETYQQNGIFYKKQQKPFSYPIQELCISGYKDARRLIKGEEYLSICEYLWGELSKHFDISDIGHNILVLGTEEFMFPALFFGRKIEETGRAVKCHASTRSPIMVSTEPNYPLYKRYELESMYEEGRKIFLYNLESYDQVFIITDAKIPTRAGVSTLIHALVSCGNKRITLVKL